jgi:hypothetical protein
MQAALSEDKSTPNEKYFPFPVFPSLLQGEGRVGGKKRNSFFVDYTSSVLSQKK